MGKIAVFFLIFGVFFVFNAVTVFADETFIFNETFNTANRINTKTTYAKIEDGKVFTADDSVSSRIESLNVARSLYNINRVKIEVVQNLPSGSRIVYFISGNKGKTWIQTDPGFFYNINSGGNSLRWAAVLARTSLDKPSPSIENLRIIFSRDSFAGDGIVSSNSDGEGLSFLGEFYDNVNYGLCLILGTSCAQEIKSSKSSGTASVTQAAAYNSSNSSSVNTLTSQNGNGNGNLSSQGPLLLRAKGTKNVFYITRRGLKRLVPNPQIFLSYGNKWSDVVQVDQAALDGYPENKYIFFEAANPHRKVYRIEGDKKYPVSGDEIQKLGLKDHEITPVNKTELDYYKPAL